MLQEKLDFVLKIVWRNSNNYLQKLNSLKKGSSKIQEEITKIKSEIEELKKINNEDIRKILSNDLPWKNPIRQEEVKEESNEEKLYKIMFWYSDCKELIEIINSDKLKEKWVATSELESMENTKSILDYITYYQEKNIELNNDNIKEIERILRAELIKRLVRVKCKEEDFANFLYGLNEKKKNITKSEFLFTYEIANKHCN